MDKPTVEELNAFFCREFTQVKVSVEALGEATADVALYAAILGSIGIVPLAVTTNLNINFLRKPAAGRDIIGECTLLKVGKTLAIGDVFIYSEGSSDPVAHATGTYAIPRR